MISRRTIPTALGVALAWASMAVAQPAQTTFGPVARSRLDAKPGHPIDPNLRKILIRELSGNKLSHIDKTTLVRWAETPLPSGSREIVVYISGGGSPEFGEMGGWCGSGGCGIEIFEAHGTHFRKIGDIQAWLPVRLLAESHENHPDLSVWVQGGGVHPGYASRIVFHNGDYPISGDQRDGHKVGSRVGTLLLNDDQAGARLFP
jgi:hypothetical protein